MQSSKRLGPVFWENAIMPMSQLDFQQRLLIAIDRLPTDFLLFFYGPSLKELFQGMN